MTELDPSLCVRLSDHTVRDFFTVMAICNTVVVSKKIENRIGAPHASQNGNVNMGRDTRRALKYEAESPDEAALVHVGLSRADCQGF